VSVQELKVLARKHWEEWLPERVKELKAEGRLNAELEAAASLAQEEIEHLMRRGYSECEAREVALPAVHPLEAGVPGAGRPGPRVGGKGAGVSAGVRAGGRERRPERGLPDVKPHGAPSVLETLFPAGEAVCTV
jgi:hypothetical protein